MSIFYSLVSGQCELTENFISVATANKLFEQVYETAEWQQQTITLFGEPVLSPRLTAWYGDKDAVYWFSGLRNTPSPWFESLLEIRRWVEDYSGKKFNSVLLNLYRDGADSVGSHSDDELELGTHPTIASLSLGATRRFILHSRCKQPNIKIDLAHGSLLIMKGRSQIDWKHSVPKTKKFVKPRINLTFRMVNGEISS